jgi:DNA-binding MarR family transcriptional regulator
MSEAKRPLPLNDSEYIALAEFRYQLRRYLRHMEAEARANGHHPQQYQLLLAIKGLPPPRNPTVSVLAERMQMNHNSLVELADRCEKRGFIRRIRSSGADRRKVTLTITAAGEAMMRQQASASRQELQTIGPILVDALQRLMRRNPLLRKGRKRLTTRAL